MDALEDLDFQSEIIAEEFNDIVNSKKLKGYQIAHGYPYIEHNKKMASIVLRKEIFLLNENFERVEKRELFSAISFIKTDQIM